MEITKAVTGSFCWVELQTTDPAAARAFYAGLFGWTITDVPAPMPYAMATLGGDKRQVAGLMPLPDQAKAMGSPPSWVSYVAVDDVKASADRAAKLGGQVLMPPTSFGPGTFAVLRDPTGAVFLIWNSKQTMGVFLFGEPGALVWNELHTSDVAAATRFYGELFGWKTNPTPMPGGTYHLLMNGDQMIGGMADARDGTPSCWNVYFAVADADATFAKAKAAGAKVVMPLDDVPQAGRLGFLADPQGAVFAILKPAPPAGAK